MADEIDIDLGNDPEPGTGEGGGTPAPATPPTDPPVPDDVSTDLGDDPDAPTEGDDAPNELHGAPEGDYEEFALPEGIAPPDTGYLTQFSALAKELNLSQAGAQKLVELHAAGQKGAIAAVEKVMTNAHAEWKRELQADPDIGGPKLAASIGLARAGFRAIPGGLGDALLNDMKVAKLTSLPSLIRLGHYLGTLHGEGGFERGAGGGDPTPKSLASRMFPNMNPD